MRVGMAVIFQNPGDARPDADVYGEELALTGRVLLGLETDASML